MIIDKLTNAEFYRGLSPRLSQAFDFLGTTDLSQLPLERIDIDGDRLYAFVLEYTTKPPEQSLWEAHRKYCDIQLMISGTECMAWNNVEQMNVTQPYAADKDAVFLDGTGTTLTVPAGMFTFFAPQDAHMCCLANGTPSTVRKIVVKVALDS